MREKIKIITLKSIFVTLVVTIAMSVINYVGTPMLISNADDQGTFQGFLVSGELYSENVAYNTAKEDIELPQTLQASILLNDDSNEMADGEETGETEEIQDVVEEREVEVIWDDQGLYNSEVPGTYKFEATPKEFTYEGEKPYITIVVDEQVEEKEPEGEEEIKTEVPVEEEIEEPSSDTSSSETAIGPLSDKPAGYPVYGGNDYTEYVKILSWDILDSAGKPLSTTNSAKDNLKYTFNFSWSIELPDNGKLAADDHFIIPVPENKNSGDAKSYWNMLASDWTSFYLKGTNTVIGQVRIYNAGGYNEIHVRFTDVAAGQNALTGIEFEFKDAIKNHSLVAIMQGVGFGLGTATGETIKQIKFEKRVLSPSAWDTKFFSSSSDNLMYYQIKFNHGGAYELSGHYYDMINTPWRWSYQDRASGTYDPNNTAPYSWGEYMESSTTGYLEDKLDPGVVVSSIGINAQVLIPMDLPSDASSGRGGTASKDPAWRSYLLFDNGRGPEYREDGKSIDNIQFPSKANSFVLVEQNPGESETSFRTRVKSSPQQYGIYVDGEGETAVRTIMINFGAMGPGGDQAKYSALTDTALTGRKTLYSNKDIPVFAAEAADYCIKNQYYSESDRDLLEEYFTETYGDTNVAGGQVATYVIGLQLRYLPGETSGTKTNTATGQLNLRTTKTKDFSLTGSGNMNNPRGDVVVNKNSVLLQKYDEETNMALTGAVFKLQRKSGSTWVDVQTNLAVNTDGQLLVEGLDTSSAGVVYRFVETTSPKDYDPKKSSFWDSTLNAVVSKEFTLKDTDLNGQKIYVGNVKKEEAKYVVQHYLEQSDGSYAIYSADTQSFYAVVGESVSATANDYSSTGHVFDNTIPGTKESGVVLADGSLVLKLYYKLNNMDFVFYKVDQSETPVSGVEFQLMKCKKTGTSGHTHSPLATNDAGNCWDVDNPIKVVSAADGKVSFPQLANGDYMLVETKTRSDLELPQGQWLISVNVSTQKITITAKGDALPPAFYTKTNGQGETIYYLPNFPKKLLTITGGTGTLAFTVVGIVIIGTAVMIAVVSKKRKRKDEQDE